MEARLSRAVLAAVILALFAGAKFQTPNFTVETANPQFAKQLGETAEQFRHDLAIAWLGEPLPNWSEPCPMAVQVGENLGAGGATSFMFDQGEVFGWRMNIQGSRERLLDSVLPHEITHMIFASYFRQPLPRWADEGGATSVEHHTERDKHRRMLVQFLQTGRGISFSEMFAMTEYPHDIMPLYAQGYSVADYLIQKGGRRKYIEFLQDGMQSGQWSECITRHYGIGGLAPLQNAWLAWVKQGSPLLESPDSEPFNPNSPPMELANAIPPAKLAEASPSPVSGQLVPIRREGGSPATSIYLASSAERQAGWRRPGQQVASTASSPAASNPSEVAASSPGPIHSQVGHPQPIEPARQVILQWRR